MDVTVFLAAFALLMIWTLVWKGLGLWRAARRGETWWFIVFLFVQTVGLLELWYLTFRDRREERR